MNVTERMIFASVFAAVYAGRVSTGNEAAEDALEQALWSVECFRQALRDREED